MPISVEAAIKARVRLQTAHDALRAALSVVKADTEAGDMLLATEIATALDSVLAALATCGRAGAN